MYQNFGELLRHDPIEAVQKLVSSIRHDDYNLLPILPLAPFYFLFGGGRLAYILAIVNLYAFPSILLFFLLCKAIFLRSYPNPSRLSTFAALTLSLLPAFWIPVLQGQPDVVGILAITMIMIFYFRRPIEDQTFKSLSFLSLLLVLMVLMRRWYAFWVVSFFLTLLWDGFIFQCPAYRLKMKKYMAPLRNILWLGIISASLLLIMATPVAKRMFFTDYADLYSAYRSGDSLIGPIQWIYDYFGFFPICLFLLGSFFSIWDKKTRRTSLFLFLHFIVTFLFFSRTQNLNAHHFYLLIPTMAIFISLIVIRLIHIRPMKHNVLFLVPFIFLYSMNFSNTFIPEAHTFLKQLSLPFSEIRFFPPVRSDIRVIRDLLCTLDHLVQSQKDLIYVLSSSLVLNEDILINASRMNHMTVHKQILPTHHVDKRDGFPHHFMDAKYVVVGDPIQYHLNPKDQRVIGILGNQILHQSGIGLSYERLPYEFILDGNVKAYIYEKKFPIKRADIEDLMKRFIGYSPDKK